MFNHKDSLRTSSYQIQIAGRKKWHLCSSADDYELYRRAGKIDMFNPDYSSFPKTRHVKTCSQFIAYPGDFIYYPKDYWHQTYMLDTPTIAISGTLVTKYCHEEIKTELKRECAGEGTIFVPEETMCGALNSCAYPLWEEIATKGFGDEL